MATTNKWHSGSPAVGGTWPFKVDLQPDELITSWLLRTALQHYCDPLSLTGSVWPKWRVWTTDPDRYIPPDRLISLSTFSGVPAEKFQNAFLQNVAHIIYGSGCSILPNGNWAWILSQGSRNRRHHAGMQVCPDCMTSEPAYLRVPWRLAWHTHCSIHNTPLIQRCPKCHHLIEPNFLVAEDRTICRCTFCKSLLVGTEDRNVLVTDMSSPALEFQSNADDVISTGIGNYNDEELPACQWFALARFFTLLLRSAADEKKKPLAMGLESLAVPQRSILMPKTGGPIEHLPVSERVRLFEGISILMHTPSEELKKAITRNCTRTSIFNDKRTPIPEPLKRLLNLPKSYVYRKRKPRSMPMVYAPKSKRRVRKMWARLLRRAFINEDKP